MRSRTDNTSNENDVCSFREKASTSKLRKNKFLLRKYNASQFDISKVLFSYKIRKFKDT